MSASQAATSYNPVYDSQGDLIGLLNTSGTLVQTLRYSPYGDYVKSEGSLAYSPTNDPFLFQGAFHIPGGNAGLGNISPGIYHFGARYYDPTTGRWTQPDALDQIGSVRQNDRFAFAAGDPVNVTDPSGLISFEAEACVAGVCGGASVDTEGHLGVSVGGGAKNDTGVSAGVSSGNVESGSSAGADVKVPGGYVGIDYSHGHTSGRGGYHSVSEGELAPSTLTASIADDAHRRENARDGYGAGLC